VRQDRGLELTPGGSLRLRRPANDPFSCDAQRDGRSRAVEAWASSRQPSEKVGEKAVIRPPTLRRIGAPRLRLPPEASVVEDVVGLSIDAKRATGSRA
jgi:hypothetical protein